MNAKKRIPIYSGFFFFKVGYDIVNIQPSLDYLPENERLSVGKRISWVHGNLCGSISINNIVSKRRQSHRSFTVF